MFGKLSKSLWLAIFWSAIIFILLSIPGKELPKGPDVPSLDKIIHIFLFGVLAYLWCCVWKFRAAGKSLTSIIIIVILACSFYGIAMEYYQHYLVANRSFELGDIIADVIGSITGSGIAYRRLRRLV